MLTLQTGKYVSKSSYEFLLFSVLAEDRRHLFLQVTDDVGVDLQVEVEQQINELQI